MLAVPLGCGLLGDRRSVRKGRHVRTVPVPAWVQVAIDLWLAIAGIDTGIIMFAHGSLHCLRGSRATGAEQE